MRRTAHIKAAYVRLVAEKWLEAISHFWVSPRRSAPLSRKFRIHPALIGVFFAVDRRNVRRIFIEIGSPGRERRKVMVWKPGESGNPKGKKPGTLKEKPYRDALRMEIAAAEDFKDLRSIARAHLEKAKSGDMAAIKELADRLDGRPAQDTSVAIEQRRPEELTDEELMAIAVGGLPKGPPKGEDVH